MASRKIKGAKETVNLIRNNVKISSFCNDVVGDICGIVMGFRSGTSWKFI